MSRSAGAAAFRAITSFEYFMVGAQRTYDATVAFGQRRAGGTNRRLRQRSSSCFFYNTLFIELFIIQKTKLTLDSNVRKRYNTANL